MDVIVTCRHCELTDEIRQLIQSRFDRLGRFERRAQRAEVTVTQVKKGFEAEGLVSVDRADRVHAKAEATEIRAAIDRVVDRLGVQLRRGHDRRHAHQAPPMDELFGPPELPDGDAAPGVGLEVE